ncbi:MAG TPA: aminotransferase class V-fold PLP-dependent enzyme [Bryobacteraceae bacterium]|nr:aminotransferase class V-fold PLP-dependent enzyme [Bryobacteraceae bacterium]
MIDWNAVRREFPTLERYTYLNTASFGQLPHRSVAAVEAHFARRDELACADFLEWFDDADEIRGLAARLIHCEPDDIAFFQNASSAVSLLTEGMKWSEGDRILTLEHEFPNQLYLAQSCGRRGDIVPYERFFSALTPRTRLVIVSTVNYTSGLRPDLEAMAEACRTNGTLFCVDGTQSLGALTLDIRKVEPDMFAVDGYKWLLSPNGAGFAYIPPRVRAWLAPRTIGWRSDKRWREVDALNHGAPEFKKSAEKYEGGMLPFPSLYGMGASISMMLELGPHEIERRALQLADCLRGTLRNLGARLLSDTDPAYISQIVAANWQGVDSSLLSRRLRDRRILTAARHGNLRVSTHFYNNEADIERLADALRDIL